MKVINNAQVFLLGSQVFNQVEFDRFMVEHNISWSSDSDVAAEQLTETAGRVCYMSFERPRPGGNEAYLTNIKSSGHGSVLEHAVYNLLITGVSRTLSHELVRHRAGMSYSQLSQRYVDESVAEYVEPDIIAADPELHQLWLESVEQSHKAYIALTDGIEAKLGTTLSKYSGVDPTPKGLRKTARQAARSVLPNATETKLFITANARALRHFIELRCSRFAEPEIRKLAGQIHGVLHGESEHLFGDYVVNDLPDGSYELTTPYRKV